MEEDKKIFRKEALTSHGTDAQLGKMMVVVTSKGWIALTCIIVFLFGIVLWSVFGVIPDTVSGQGVVLSGKGNYIIEGPVNAYVAEIFVKEGEFIKKGQPVMRLEDDALEISLVEAYKTKALILEQKKEFEAQQSSKIASQTKALLAAIEANQYHIKVTKQELVFLKQQLAWQQDLNKEGLTTLAQINDTQLKINEQYNILQQAAINIQETQAKLLNLTNILEEQAFDSKLQAIEEKIAQQEYTKSLLNVPGSYDGFVIDIPVAVGNNVKVGDRIFWAEIADSNEHDYVIFSYFVPGKEQRIKPGMLAVVTLNSVDNKLYGSLMAVVEKVNLFPVTSQEIQTVLGNANLSAVFTKNGAISPTQVVLRPLRDSSTVSGYKWTSVKGPPFQIHSGILGSVEVRILDIRPIEFVFPIFRSFGESVRVKKILEEYSDE